MATTPSDQAKVRAPEAAQWIVAAGRAVNYVGVTLALENPASITTMKAGKEWAAMQTHFHVNDANALDVAKFVQQIYNNIADTLSQANRLFVDGAPSAPYFGLGPLGGTRYKDDPKMADSSGRMWFGPNFLKGKRLFQTAVIVHEAAHFADQTIDHWASELPAPDGWPVDGALHTGNTKKYSELTSTQAMQNAYSYAQFALHMFMGFDKRLHFRQLSGGDFESE